MEEKRENRKRRKREKAGIDGIEWRGNNIEASRRKVWSRWNRLKARKKKEKGGKENLG